jgi:hypothetical protein
MFGFTKQTKLSNYAIATRKYKCKYYTERI